MHFYDSVWPRPLRLLQPSCLPLWTQTVTLHESQDYSESSLVHSSKITLNHAPSLKSSSDEKRGSEVEWFPFPCFDRATKWDPELFLRNLAIYSKQFWEGVRRQWETFRNTAVITGICHLTRAHSDVLSYHCHRGICFQSACCNWPSTTVTFGGQTVQLPGTAPRSTLAPLLCQVSFRWWDAPARCH